MNNQETEIKKVIAHFILVNYRSCKVFLKENIGEPDETTWATLYFLRIQKNIGRGSRRTWNGILSFSIFSSVLDNIFDLDEKVDDFKKLCENNKISQNQICIEFFEGETVSLREFSGKELNTEKIITYRVITVPFTAEITE